MVASAVDGIDCVLVGGPWVDAKVGVGRRAAGAPYRHPVAVDGVADHDAVRVGRGRPAEPDGVGCHGGRGEPGRHGGWLGVGARHHELVRPDVAPRPLRPCDATLVCPTRASGHARRDDVERGTPRRERHRLRRATVRRQSIEVGCRVRQRMIRHGEAAGRAGVDVVATVGYGRRRVAVRPLQAVTHDALADREGVPAIIQDVGAIGRRVRVERGLGDGRLPEVLNRATTVPACSVPVEGAVADREARVVVDGATTRTFV